MRDKLDNKMNAVMRRNHVPTFALIGAGVRGLDCFGQYLLKNPDRGRLVAVADPNPIRRTRAASEHGIPTARVYKSDRELLEAGRLADATIIATTDRLHYRAAIKAASMGYHILLEKPMAPTPDECQRITEAADQAGIMLIVAHVLRYASFYQQVKDLIDSNAIGELCHIQHLEGVAWWHFAHSYVRGNFAREDRSSSVLLAKSCHDLDVLNWWVGQPCQRVSSFGQLKHFRREVAPPEAVPCCMDCTLADNGCPYSAKAFYFDRLRKEQHGWPLSMVTDTFTEASLSKALRSGPYGKCVYDCDNDVCDTQTVILEFEGSVSVDFTLSAFTPHGRRIRIMGTHGYLEGNEHSLRKLDFGTSQWVEYNLNQMETSIVGGHGGGDQLLMEAFCEALVSGNTLSLATGPEETLTSHMIVFAAERARREHRVVELSEMYANLMAKPLPQTQS